MTSFPQYKVHAEECFPPRGECRLHTNIIMCSVGKKLTINVHTSFSPASVILRAFQRISGASDPLILAVNRTHVNRPLSTHGAQCAILAMFATIHVARVILNETLQYVDNFSCCKQSRK